MNLRNLAFYIEKSTPFTSEKGTTNLLASNIKRPYPAYRLQTIWGYKIISFFEYLQSCFIFESPPHLQEKIMPSEPQRRKTHRSVAWPPALSNMTSPAVCLHYYSGHSQPHVPTKEHFNRLQKVPCCSPFVEVSTGNILSFVPKWRLSLQIWPCALCIEDKVRGFSLDHFTPGTNGPPQSDTEEREVARKPRTSFHTKQQSWEQPGLLSAERETSRSVCGGFGGGGCQSPKERIYSKLTAKLTEWLIRSLIEHHKPNIGVTFVQWHLSMWQR